MVDPLAENAEISLEFSLPHNAERLNFGARVTRVLEGPAPGESNGRGVGVEFTSVQPRHRRLVVAFVEKTLASLVSSSF